MKLINSFKAFLFVVLFLMSATTEIMGLASPSSSSSSQPLMLYGVPNSGWRSSQWNWGYAVGTGHDCAAICRARYASRQSRVTLIEQLLNPDDNDAVSSVSRQPKDFEEVKLVLALAWQRGRWDGSDGGIGGYGDVLRHMAEAKRYEIGEDKHRLLLEDMQSRFVLLKPKLTEIEQMKSLGQDSDVDRELRICCGLVLQAMGFADRGL